MLVTQRGLVTGVLRQALVFVAELPGGLLLLQEGLATSARNFAFTTVAGRRDRPRRPRYLP